MVELASLLYAEYFHSSCMSAHRLIPYQNTAKPQSALTYTHGRLRLTLLLSSLSDHAPLSYPFGELSLPASILRSPPRNRHDLPPRIGEPAFQPEQELFHTFRDDEKTVGFVKSAIGTALALSPWVALAFLVNLRIFRFPD